MNHQSVFLSLLVLLVIPVTSCRSDQSARSAQTYDQLWQDPGQPVDDRVADLLSRMTLEEKVSQMIHSSAAIDRLGIPAYNWWSECLHGVARFGRATVYPQAIGLAATWDADLIRRIGNANSDEGRASFHAAERRGIVGKQYGGLTYWTPNINIFRDPRWGRGQETYGEDPFLTATLGSALVRGIQGDHPKYLKAGACGKHYVVHSGPEGLRHEFNAISSKKDMYETYLPAFKALVDAGVESIMCAYNRTNDEACCGSEYLLKGILREDWGFTGHIVSDCWAIIDFYAGHGVSETETDAAALALKSGVNVNCGSTFPYLLDAVEKGLVTKEEIDESLAYLLRSRFRLGLFDPPELVPFTSITTDVIHCKEHQDIALEAARKCIVLLKNKNNVLPLAKDLESIYIYGPNAADVDVMLGNYYGLSSDMSTILEGIVGKVEPGCFVEYRKGVLLDRYNVNPIDWATEGAKEKEAVIAVMGINPMLEGEEGEALISPTKGDRFDIKLHPNQVDKLKDLRDGYDKPIILVLTGGSPIDVSEVVDIVDAILFVWYPGEKGGLAVADILYGDVNPSGRMPITFPRSLDDLPPYEDYSMAGRTYRYMTKEPMFPFGFGLSYTSFSYSAADTEIEMNAGEEITVEVTIRNDGQVAGEEVVQLYVSDLEASVTVPLSSLKDFRRVHLEPGESKTLSFTIGNEQLSIIDDDGKSILEPGEFRITVGGSSPGSRSLDLGASSPAEIVLSVL